MSHAPRGVVPTPAPPFSPTLAAAQARIAAIRPADYARSRNAIGGAVSGLSPYITHGVVTLPQVLAGVAAIHAVHVQHKLVFELGWREYFQHVWQHRGDAIFQSLHPGPLPDEAYARELPADIRQARTGVPVIDTAVRALYADGYLHNHARMWLASYVVHLRKVHWRVGADWLYGHLLDGDLASNHLSWQWIAGTGSHKPYLFNADNVARFAPAEWHSPGSVIDQPYEALDLLARSAEPLVTAPLAVGVDEPALLREPPAALGFSAPDAEAVAGCDVWLMHPCALRAPPPDLPPHTRCIGVCLADFHSAWPWNAKRWTFVGDGMAALTTERWFADAATASKALRGARSVHTVSDLHVNAQSAGLATCHATPRLFAPVEDPRNSFSQWWTRVTRGVHHVNEFPGMALTPVSTHQINQPGTPHEHTDEPTARDSDRRARWHRP